MIYNNVELINVREITNDANGNALLNRLPSAVRLKTDEKLRTDTSFETGGCEIRFVINSGEVNLYLDGHSTFSKQGIEVAEVFYGDYQSLCPLYIKNGENKFIIKMPDSIEKLRQMAQKFGCRFSPDLVRVVLPVKGKVALKKIEGDISLPNVDSYPHKTIMFYGSSITNGEGANIPSRTYIYKTAETLKTEVINMGFGASARLEPAIADFIAEEGKKGNWDVLSLELGVNMRFGEDDFNLFCERIEYFIEKIAAENFDKPIFVLDVFSCGMDYDNSAHISKIRKVVSDKVKQLNLNNLHHVDGTNILESIVGLTWDLSHPAGSGMCMMAENYVEYLKPFVVGE